MGLFEKVSEGFSNAQQEEMSLQEFLTRCKSDPMMYASAFERMLKVIGEPETIETRNDPRLSRIFMNRTIRRYPAFKEFFGMEDAIEQIVSYFRHAAQGLEERKQVLYLLGPVGAAKSSIAEKLKQLMEVHPIYVLKAGDQISPINENPLGLFDPRQFADELQSEYGIARRYLTGICSPWALKRLEEFKGDVTKFRVVKRMPSTLRQIAISKIEAGDKTTQDISTLVGKLDLHLADRFSQADPDAYSWSGGLCLGNRCGMEFVEMFKADKQIILPMLSATQEGSYKGTEGFGVIPFEGFILAHSNESEWKKFSGNKDNEAFLDRIYLVKVPYCLRVDEEVLIYKKQLELSSLSKAPCAPRTLEMMAEFSILTRLSPPENSNVYSKLRVYNGENLRDIDPQAKSVQEYRDMAGPNEGMSGQSTRAAYKLLAKTFNYDQNQEVSANPVHLMLILEKSISGSDMEQGQKDAWLAFIKEHLFVRYKDFIGKDIQRAYVEAYDDYGQNLFERYIAQADCWLQDQPFKNPDTGLMINKEQLGLELDKFEKPAGIANPKEFRGEMVNFCLRARASNNGTMPNWKSYEKIREVLEKKMFYNIEEMLPIISFGTKASQKDQEEHTKFVERMKKRGYATDTMVRTVVEWWQQTRNSN